MYTIEDGDIYTTEVSPSRIWQLSPLRYVN